jgi:hypothetical protein
LDFECDAANRADRNAQFAASAMRLDHGMHPKANDEFSTAGEGVLIETVQAPPEVTAAFNALATTRSELS